MHNIIQSSIDRPLSAAFPGRRDYHYLEVTLPRVAYLLNILHTLRNSPVGDPLHAAESQDSEQ